MFGHFLSVLTNVCIHTHIHVNVHAQTLSTQSNTARIRILVHFTATEMLFSTQKPSTKTQTIYCVHKACADFSSEIFTGFGHFQIRTGGLEKYNFIVAQYRIIYFFKVNLLQ